MLCFEREDDAHRVLAVLAKRLGVFGLELHPDKTRLISFVRPTAEWKGGKGPGTFDFLGFTLFWKRTRGGRWALACKTRGARLRRAVQRLEDFCRRHRHKPLREQHAGLSRRLRGHYNYFGVNGNFRALTRVEYHARRCWRKWLCRRSQGRRMGWTRFSRMLERFPLPRPAIVVRIWSS